MSEKKQLEMKQAFVVIHKQYHIPIAVFLKREYAEGYIEKTAKDSRIEPCMLCYEKGDLD